MIPLMKVHLPPNVGEIVNKVVETGFVTEGEFSDEFDISISFSCSYV